MEALRPASRCLHKRTTAGGPITNVISHPSAVRCVKGLVPTSHDMPPLLKIPTTNTSVSITEKEVHAANKRRTIRIMSDSSRPGSFSQSSNYVQTSPRRACKCRVSVNSPTGRDGAGNLPISRFPCTSICELRSLVQP
jgi:hypothetical protein